MVGAQEVVPSAVRCCLEDDEWQDSRLYYLPVAPIMHMQYSLNESFVSYIWVFVWWYGQNAFDNCCCLCFQYIWWGVVWEHLNGIVGVTYHHLMHVTPHFCAKSLPHYLWCYSVAFLGCANIWVSNWTDWIILFDLQTLGINFFPIVLSRSIGGKLQISCFQKKRF